MGVKMAAGNFLQHSPPHCSSSSPQTLPAIVSSISAKRNGGASERSLISCQVFRQIGCRSPFLATGSSSCTLPRRRSLQDLRRSVGGGNRARFLRRAFSASMDSNEAEEDDDEFVRRLQELALELQEDDHNSNNIMNQSSSASASVPSLPSVRNNDTSPLTETPWLDGDEIMPASLEMKASRLDLPLSLRIIKRKKRLEEGLKDAGESAYCSIKKAFSSMVFIVRELHSYTLQMRELLFYENLQGILARVQGEMNASFVWLFQQIFSCTPTFMVYVMLLLANFTVYSIGNNSAMAAVVPNPQVVAVEQEYEQKKHQQQSSRFDASSIKSFSAGRSASVGGSGGGGGKVKPVAGATDDGGRSNGSYSSYVAADGISVPGVEAPETVMNDDDREEETAIWNRIVEEASRMQASSRHEALMDYDTLNQLVSPVSVELEHENYAEYSARELIYLQLLSQDPENILLLSNIAQFLFLVLHDHDRAEYYFKRAAKIKPGDAEALYRYANFLWIAKKDLEGAEEAYLEAISADPGNSHYAASYANFLWNTGGEETCYPLDGSDAC